MSVYKEFGHKDGTYIMQEVVVDGVTYLIESNNTVHEKKTNLPVVKDKELIKAILAQAEKGQ